MDPFQRKTSMTNDFLTLQERKEILKKVPWITFFKDSQTCTAINSSNYKPCRRKANWKFKGKRSRDPLEHGAPDGIYCYTHLIWKGLYYSMYEEERFLKWFDKHYPPPEVTE